MKQRLITGVLFGGIMAVPFYLGGEWFAGCALLLALLAYTEWASMAKITTQPLLFGCGSVAIIGLFTTVFLVHTSFSASMIMGALVLVLLLLMTFQSTVSIEQIGITLLGVFYIGYGFLAFAQLRITMDLLWTLGVLLFIIGADTGAYMVGKKWGKQKLAPAISPNKTIEGACGGVATAIVLAIFLQSAFQPFTSYGIAIVMACIVAIAGQVGDLVQSAVKRHYGVKDAGHILPGHGGIFDRTDSWIFVFLLLSILPIVW